MIVIWHPTVPRINRNIVECKLNIQLFAEGDAGGINRNIVECKYMRKSGLLGYPVTVLIETLWNVN